MYILIWGTYYHKFGQNIDIFKIVCTKYMASSEGMTSSTHSFAYSYWCFQKCFVKICETSGDNLCINQGHPGFSKGGRRKRLCVAGVQGPLKGPWSPRVSDALSCSGPYFEAFWYKTECPPPQKKKSWSHRGGGGGEPVVPPFGPGSTTANFSYIVIWQSVSDYLIKIRQLGGYLGGCSLSNNLARIKDCN